MKFENPPNPSHDKKLDGCEATQSDAAARQDAESLAAERELEQQLARLKPRGLRAELRPRVLAGVNAQLLMETPSLWLRRAAVGMAASLFLGIALNIAANQAADRHIIALFGSLPVPNANAERAMAEYNMLTQKLLAEMNVSEKDGFHDDKKTPEKNAPMGWNRAGGFGGDWADC
jgi:hypothetical protein